MKNGFIKLQRDIQGTWIHKDPIYFKAWIDILFNVNWEEKKVFIGTTQYLCASGESLNSLDTWASIFGKEWDKSKVRRFFKRLTDATLIDTQNERKTTRLKVLGIACSEYSRHTDATQTDTQMQRKPTPTKELRKKEVKEEDSFDRRTNLNLPFDVVTSSQTIKAIFEDTNLAIQRVKEIYQIEATDQDVKTAMRTFSTVAIASYDQYKGIRTVEKLTNKFLEWIPKSITYESKPKRTNGKDESTDLEAYILQHYRPVDLKHMKKDGRFDRWQEQLQESKFKLSNIAKTKSNKNYTTMFLFDCCYMTLGNKLGGSNEQRRIESLNRWEKSLSDYNRNQGDLRNLLKAKPQC